MRYNLFQCIRILGLIGLLAWTSILLLVWVSVNMQGDTYFLAGEPDLKIKYAEWLLGIIGIITGFEYLVREISNAALQRL